MLLRCARVVGEKKGIYGKKLFARFTAHKIAQQPLHWAQLNQQEICSLPPPKNEHFVIEAGINYFQKKLF